NCGGSRNLYTGDRADRPVFGASGAWDGAGGFNAGGAGLTGMKIDSASPVSQGASHVAAPVSSTAPVSAASANWWMRLLRAAKRALPLGWKLRVDRARALRRLVVNYVYDFRRYRRWSSVVAAQASRENLRARITME